MKYNYFVTVKGITVLENCSQKQALNRAIKEHDKNPKLGSIDIGIGKTKIYKGSIVYNLQPYHLYI